MSQLYEQFQQIITLVAAEKDKLSLFINGSDSQTIDTEYGELPTLAKWLAERTVEMTGAGLLPLFSDIATAISNTEDGDYFVIVNTAGNNLFDAFKRIDGQSVLQGSFISTAGVNQLMATEQAARAQDIATERESRVSALRTELVQRNAQVARLADLLLSMFGYLDVDNDDSFSITDSLNKAALAITRNGALATNNIEQLATSDNNLFTDLVWGVLDERMRAAFAFESDGRYAGVSVDELRGDLRDFVTRFLTGVADEFGRISLGVAQDGKVWLIPDDETLRLIVDHVSGTQEAALVQKARRPVSGSSQFALTAISADINRILSDVDGRTRSYITLTADESGTYIFDTGGRLHFIPATGQSLSVGGGAHSAVALGIDPIFTHTPPAPQYALMFNNGCKGTNQAVLDEATLTSFVPAYEQYEEGSTQGESQGSGLMNALHTYQIRNALPESLMLYRSHGSGGRKITEINNGQIPFANGLKELQRAIDIAASYGKTVRVSGITFTQGEADRLTDPASYKAALIQLAADYNSIWAPYLPADNGSITLIVDQLMTAGSGVGSMISQVQWEACRDNDGLVMSTPKYFFTKVDSDHLLPAQYTILGEYQARVLAALDAGETWQPTSPVSFTLTDNLIDVVFHVPVGALVLDTTTLPAASNYGFAYTDDSTSAAISSVELLTDNTVRIHLSAIPTGTNKTLSYAYNGPGASNRAGAWGNLRDSCDDISIHDDTFTLHNWCVIFSEVLP